MKMHTRLVKRVERTNCFWVDTCCHFVGNWFAEMDHKWTTVWQNLRKVNKLAEEAIKLHYKAFEIRFFFPPIILINCCFPSNYVLNRMKSKILDFFSTAHSWSKQVKSLVCPVLSSQGAFEQRRQAESKAMLHRDHQEVDSDPFFCNTLPDLFPIQV